MNHMLLTATNLGEINLFDLRANKCIFTDQVGHPITKCRFNPYNSQFAVASWKNVKIYDSNHQLFNEYSSNEWITSLDFFNDNLYYGGWSKTINHVDQHSSNSIGTLDVVTCLCTLTDGTVAYSNLTTELLTLCDMAYNNETQILTEAPVNCITSPSEKLIITGEENSINLIDRFSHYSTNKFICSSRVTSIHARNNNNNTRIIAGDVIGNLYYLALKE